MNTWNVVLGKEEEGGRGGGVLMKKKNMEINMDDSRRVNVDVVVKLLSVEILES